MTFLSYKRVAVLLTAIILVLSGFMAFGSAGAQGQGINVGDTVATGAGIDKDEFCSLSSGLSKGEIESITGRTAAGGLPSGTKFNVSSDTTQPANESTTGSGAGITNLEWGGLCSYSLAKFIVNWVSIIVGIIALLFMMYAAFLFISGKASDGAQKNTNARNVLIAAIVGFAIVILSQAILRLIVGLFS